jgi:hypothetical protein
LHLTVFPTVVFPAQEDFLSQHGILAAGGALVTTSKALEEAETALPLGEIDTVGSGHGILGGSSHGHKRMAPLLIPFINGVN